MTKKSSKIVEELLSKMGFKVEIELIESDQGFINNILTEESSLLIGRGGENLKALQHIVNLISYQESIDEELEKIFLDVNNYRKKQKESLLVLVDRVSEQVLRTGMPEVLRPMSGYERRTVHLELTKNPGLMTESIGEEPNRRIVVKIKK